MLVFLPFAASLITDRAHTLDFTNIFTCYCACWLAFWKALIKTGIMQWRNQGSRRGSCPLRWAAAQIHVLDQRFMLSLVACAADCSTSVVKVVM